jgi:hypothetical protein
MNASKQEIAAIVGILVGKQIWHANSGGSAGSSFSLAIGGMRPREQRLRNPDASPQFQEFQGDHSLYVWCTWRVETHQSLASSDQDHAVFGTVIQSLVGSTIISASVFSRLHDLRIETTNGVLSVFCDHVPPQMSFNGNWEMTFPGGSLTLGPGLAVNLEHELSGGA